MVTWKFSHIQKKLVANCISVKIYSFGYFYNFLRTVGIYYILRTPTSNLGLSYIQFKARKTNIWMCFYQYLLLLQYLGAVGIYLVTQQAIS